jgi:hypothetical protein
VCRRGWGGGEVVELVLEFEDDALGGFLADAGDLDEGGVVAGADGLYEAGGVDAGEDGDGEFGADAGDGEELLEEGFFLGLGEAVEGERVLGDAGVDVEPGFAAFGGQGGVGGDGDGDLVADAGTLEDGAVGGLGEDEAAEVGDHGFIVTGVVL